MGIENIKTLDQAVIYAKRKVILSESCNDVDVNYNKIILSALQDKQRRNNNRNRKNLKKVVNI